MMPTRNQLLVVGLLLFLAGLQARMVASVTLSERSSRFVSAQLGEAGGQTRLWQGAPARRVVQPPRWLGLALMSVGAVVTAKSLSMKGA